MGIQSKIQAKLAKAFDGKLSDAVKPFAGGITLPGAWDPVTEEATDPVVIAYTGRGVFDSYRVQMVDGVMIRATDQLLICLANEIVGGVPAMGHKINGFDVVNIQMDPALAHYEIQLRQV